MDFKKWTIDFLTTAVLTWVVAVIVSFLYNWIVHGEGVADWATAFRLAIIFGIVLTWIGARSSRSSP